MRAQVFVTAMLAMLAVASAAAAQSGADSGSALFIPNTPNVKLLSHIPLGRSQTIAGLTMDQDITRPYVYVSRMQDVNSPA